MSTEQQKKKWTKENSMSTVHGNSIPPSYPNEVLVKTFASSYYSENFRPLEVGQKVLDVGCGSANNLTFFMDRGCQCFGVDVTEDMVEIGKENMKRLGYGDADIRVGENTKLPFADNTFDVLLSVGALHYSPGVSGVDQSLKEFSRVVAEGGRIFILTTGPEHIFRQKSKRHGVLDWEVMDYGFRTGDRLSIFDDAEHFKNTLSKYFDDVEVGNYLEKYPAVTIDSLFAICSNKP